MNVSQPMNLNKIYCGNCLDVMRSFPDESIDCVVTSPPYWGLRDYGESTKFIWDDDKSCHHVWETINRYSIFCQNCGAWHGQLGLEPTPNLYIQHLSQIFDEVNRILKKTGTCWVNIGDTYASGNRDKGKVNLERLDSKEAKHNRGWHVQPNRQIDDIPQKSLCAMPERFVLAMLDMGWVRRNTIIWYKRNAMPSSAKDRFTVDFEYFYFFTKSPKYFFEQQIVPYDKSLNRWGGDTFRKSSHKYIEMGGHDGNQNFGATSMFREGRLVRPNPKGKNMRCTWDIPLQGFPEAHFAVFPEKLCEVPIQAGCPKDGVVLDPFMGAGTVAIVAHKLKRNWIGIEMNPKYIQIAEKRIANAKQQLTLDI